MPKLEACGRCQGKGAEPGSGTITCPACHGRGEQIYSQGFLSVRRTCSSCGGAGQIVKQVCRDCRGEGYKQVSKRLRVTVPAGIADGNRLRVPGEGQPGANGGPNGDLYIFFAVKEHPIFERHENDLHCTVPITVAQAVLGDEIRRAHARRPARACASPKERRAAPNCGSRAKAFPKCRAAGAAISWSTSTCRIPTKLTREQRKLFEQLADTLPVNNEPHEKGLFEKVKDLFM